MGCNRRPPRADRLLVACLLMFAWLCPAAAGDPAAGLHNVLLLHSFSQRNRYTQLQREALVSALMSDEAPSVTVLEEFMDGATRSDEAYLRQLAAFYGRKYDDKIINLIITTDTFAVDFLLGPGAGFCPGTPLVFSGLTGMRPGLEQGDRRATGVMEALEPQATIDLALRLHPTTRRVLLICDETGYGLKLRGLVEPLLPGYAARVRFEWTPSEELPQLRARLAAMDEGSLAVFLAFTDLSDPRVRNTELLASLCAACPRPMYALTDAALGTGVVGGRLVSGEFQGRAAAELALRVLLGESASGIPISSTSPNVYMFDARALRRFGIAESSLPLGSVVRFRPSTGLDDYWGWLGLGLAGLASQAVIIVLLWRNRRQRIRAERASRRSEQFVASILDTISAHVAVLDETGKIVSVNASWRRFAEENGLSAADHGVGANYLEICERTGSENAAEAQRVGAAIRQIIGGGLEEFRHAYPCHGPERKRWFQTHLSRLQASEAGRLLIVVAHEEITELHTISEALHRSEEKYRRLVEGTGVIVWEADPQTFACTYVSAGAEALLGFPIERWYEPGFWLNRVHADERDAVDGRSREHIARGEDHRLEYRMVAADGREVWFEDVVSVEIRQGRLLKVRGVMIDVTERKQAELALADREARLRAILDSEPECVKTVDREGTLLDINAAGVRMIEAESLEQVAGRRALDLVLAEDHEVYSGLHRAALAGGNPSAQFRIVGLRGTMRWVESTAVPLRGPGGELAGVLSVTRDITERRRIEELLRESEQRYRRLFEVNMAGVFYSTASGAVKGCNEAFARIFGFDSVEAAMAAPSMEYYESADDRGRYLSELRKTGRLSGHEIRMRRRDGAELWLLENVQLLASGAGGEEIIFGTFIDITARKLAEQALAQSERRFRGIFEHANVGICLVSTEGRFVEVNPALCRMLGYGEAELVGRTFASITHPDDLGTNLDYFGEAVRGERTSYAMEKRYLRLDGGVTWASLTAVAVPDAQGRTKMLVSVVADISDRKRAELALREAHEHLERRVLERTAQLAESESRFRTLHEAAFEGLAICDAGEILEVNEALAGTFGYSRGELIGRAVSLLVAAESRADVEARLAGTSEAAAADEPREALGLGREGRAFPIEFRTKEMPFLGRQARVLAVRDLSARQRAEEEAQRHREELAHLQRLSTANELAAGLAHELNTPLCSLVNYTSGCVNRLMLDANHDRGLVAMMGKAVEEAQRAAQVIRSLREFLQKRNVEKSAASLNRIVERSVGLIRREAERLGVSLSVRLQSDLPPIEADAIQIEQVVLNLLRNACEALAEAPSDQRRVTLTTDRAEGQARLRVWDSGRGIPPEMGDRIFNPFVSTKPQGMGLGLSISRSIVEAHGGRLALLPGMESGTAFVLTLPVGSGETNHEPRAFQADGLHCR